MDVFSALGEPTRRNIIEMLAARGQLTATDISDQFKVSPPAISQHLKVLREAKLVEMEKKAQKHIYRINPGSINELEQWAKKIKHLWNERFDKLDKLLAEEKRKAVKLMSKNELVIERIFDAPVETVWKYWTEPELLKKWWGPKVFTCPYVEIDFRVGGKYLSCMRGAPQEGAPVQDFWSTGTYKEIIPMKKIVATDSFADEKGNIVPSTHYGMEGFPLEMFVTFEFEEIDGKTKMTLTHSGIKNLDEATRKGMHQGWNESFDKIVGVLAAKGSE